MATSSLERRFLDAMQRSYQKVLERGPRSNEKTKILHGWVQDELRRELDAEYAFTGQTPTSGTEATVSGMYYDKRVDILITRDGQELGVVSIKFVISSYRKNAINYFEQQIGEIANLRRKNIVYGNLFCVTNPMPRLSNGKITGFERLAERDIQHYIRLRDDYEHVHSPDEMAIGIVDLDTEQNAITAITDLSTLDFSDASVNALRTTLSVSQFFKEMADGIARRHRRYRLT